MNFELNNIQVWGKLKMEIFLGAAAVFLFSFCVFYFNKLMIIRVL